MPLQEISDFIVLQIAMQAEAIHTSETAWLLFFARELQLHVPAAALAGVLNLRSSANALLTLDLLQRGLIDGQITPSFWRSFANAKGLASEMWLAAYEITKKNWWPTVVQSTFATSHEFFSDIWNRNIEFYDPTRKARPQRVRIFLSTPTDTSVALDGIYP
jgi:hypothetical protein